jgi:putative ABC transport system permease protein
MRGLGDLARAQVRQAPAAFAAVAATSLLAVATITLFASLIAADVATPAHLKPQGPGEDGLGVIAGIFAEGAIVVSLLVMVNGVGFAVRRQLRELALLRTVAATPRQVRALVRRQVALVVAAVTPAGWVLGAAGARVLLPALKDHGYAAEAIEPTANPLPMVIATVATLAIALAAAAVGTRRATRRSPAEALADTAAEPRRVDRGRRALGGVALAALAVLTVVNLGQGGEAAVQGAFPVLLAALAALAVLGPLAVRGPSRLLGALPRSLSPRIGWLADAHLQGHTRRLASAVVPLAVLGALAVNFLLIPATLDARAAGGTHAADAAVASGFTDPDENWLRLVELAMFGLIAGVAVVNTLVALTVDRRAELRLLQQLGATDRDLLRMLAVESALVVAVGLLLAAVAGGISLVTFTHGVTGSPVPSVPMVPCLVIAGVAAALAVPGVLVAGRAVLRPPEQEEETRAAVAPAAA